MYWATPVSGSRANMVVDHLLSPGRMSGFQTPGFAVPWKSRLSSGSYVIHDHTVLPPNCQLDVAGGAAAGGHVRTPSSAPWSFGYGGCVRPGTIRTSLSGPVLHARQSSRPVSASRAAMNPRTPISAPLFPTKTLFLTMSGAIVIVCPVLGSPLFVRQSSRPVLASTATVVLSRTLKMTLSTDVVTFGSRR